MDEALHQAVHQQVRIDTTTCKGISGFGIGEGWLLKWLIALWPVLRHHLKS
ncbi:MAG: hypothetical protein Q8Q99_06970 [Polaromonas sp.]|nr:hypothetical protein [Polaromonas sp.]